MHAELATNPHSPLWGIRVNGDRLTRHHELGEILLRAFEDQAYLWGAIIYWPPILSLSHLVCRHPTLSRLNTQCRLPQSKGRRTA